MERMPTEAWTGRSSRTMSPDPLRRKAARVCQIVFGYEQTVRRGGTSRVYRHPGYLERPGARWVGQSVLLLRAADARDLERDLRRLGVRPRMARVRIRPAEAMAFRRAP